MTMLIGVAFSFLLGPASSTEVRTVPTHVTADEAYGRFLKGKTIVRVAGRVPGAREEGCMFVTASRSLGCGPWISTLTHELVQTDAGKQVILVWDVVRRRAPTDARASSGG